MKYLIFLLLSLSLFAKDSGLVFSALVNDDWKVIVYENKKFIELETQYEPRTFDYDFVNKRLAYIASDKNLYIKNKSDEKEEMLLKADIDAYTQPMFNPSGDKIIIVKLVEGNSVNTDIVSIDPETKKIKTVVSQRSTQLEPYILNDANLYYSNVSCVEGCGKIIQEVWYKHILSGDAYQLTLTNAISHQPSVDKAQEYIYFSSNRDGHYHIWKMSLKTNVCTQLTRGVVTDGYPMPTREGKIMFIRRGGSVTMLMQITKDGDVTQVKLPKKYKKIRNLKVQR